MEDNTDPEVIRQRMAENRQALTDKLEALEQQVLGVATTVTDTVTSVKEGVQETVEAVKDTVQDTVGTVKDTVTETVETVKETFNLRLQFERRPWVMLGGSFGAGVLLSALLRRRTVERVGRAVRSVGRRFTGYQEPVRTPEEARVAAAEPVSGNGAHRSFTGGLADNLFGPFKDSLTRIKDAALGTLFGTLQRVLVRELPEAVESQVKAFIDDTVNRLKGAVKHEPAPEAQPEPQQQPEQSRRWTQPQETGAPRRPGSW